MMLRTGSVALLLAVAFGPGSTALAGETQRGELKNGLKVLIRPIQGAKNVALVVLYDIGGDHDPEGRSGLGHLIEHLYVTAAAGETPARTAQQFFQQYPAGSNAQTGEEYTVIATVFPGEDLKKELHDAAARMKDLGVEQADLDRERPRLVQEVSNMFAGIPMLAAQNLAGEQVRPTPLGGRKGGLPDHVARITLQEVRDRLSKYYKPANAILVVAGAVKRESALAAIKAAFGSVPEGQGVPEPSPEGKGRLGKIDVVEVKSVLAASGSASLVYRAPLPISDLYPPYLVLLQRLFLASPMQPPGQPAVKPSGFGRPLDDPGKVYVLGPAEKGEPPEESVKRLEEFLAKATGPDLQKGEASMVKMSLARFLWTDSLPDASLALQPYGAAFALGRQVQLGVDPGALEEALEKLTKEDLRSAANEIFGPDRRGAVVVKVRE